MVSAREWNSEYRFVDTELQPSQWPVSDDYRGAGKLPEKPEGWTDVE